MERRYLLSEVISFQLKLERETLGKTGILNTLVTYDGLDGIREFLIIRR